MPQFQLQFLIFSMHCQLLPRLILLIDEQPLRQLLEKLLTQLKLQSGGGHSQLRFYQLIFQLRFWIFLKLLQFRVWMQLIKQLIQIFSKHFLQQLFQLQLQLIFLTFLRLLMWQYLLQFLIFLMLLLMQLQMQRVKLQFQIF